MNHVLKKMQVAGAGKKKKPKPPVYKPPEMGELQYGASFSYAETLDLISDGPIEGLVNEWGDVMEGLNILKGIYLDDTPIAVSNDDTALETSLSETQEDAMEIKSMEIANVTTAGKGIRGLRNFFKGINGQSSHSRDGKISTLNAGEEEKIEALMIPHVAFLFLKIRINDGFFDLAPGWNESSLFIRAFIQDNFDTNQRFYWYLDTLLNSGGAGTSQANAAFRNERFPRGVQRDRNRIEETDEGTGFPQSLYWTDENTLDTSKFFIGFQPSEGESLGQFTQTILEAQKFVEDDLNAILALWNDNNVEGGNSFQKDLAAKALTNLGWNGEGTNTAALLAERVNERKQLFVIVKASEENNSYLDQTILDGDDNLLDMKTFLYGANERWGLENALGNVSEGSFRKIDVTCPTVDTDGKLTGDMHGFVLLTFNYHVSEALETITTTGGKIFSFTPFNTHTIAFLGPLNRLFADIQSLQYTNNPSGGVERVNEYQNSSNLKFNYSNVLAEVKTGEENQKPLKFFQRIFIDHLYNKELFGPFGTASAQGNPLTQGAQTNAPQRIHGNADLLTRSEVLNLNATNFNTEMEGELPVDEGSDDERNSQGVKNYSQWGANSLIQWDEKAISSTHTVYNPNVTQVFITLNIQALQDTLVKKVNDVGGDTTIDFEVGHKFPTVLNIKVETGTLGNYENGAKGGEDVTSVHNYRIVALIEGQTLIDIGNPDNTSGRSNKDYVVNLDERQTSLNVPFKLPPAKITATTTFNADTTEGHEGGTAYQDSVQKRFVRVTKLSYETNSVLISKVVMLNKVTEIIEANCPYPFSAIVGTKLDSRAFGSIPKRSFDCKLKLVKIPNNYNPTTHDGKDRRYYKTNNEFTNTSKDNKLVYAGDWNGQFHSQLQWTDNPAWILYDLLTNTRYGMGSHIDADKINKWQLYKIGRFCDAVDDDGYFEGVTDGRGGKEPRFSCNVVFDQGQKIYDAITTITEIFRGRVFFGNSEINFVDDRPREPINLFTNESVKEGQFFYSNNRRDQQYNTIEVSFKDRFDNFSPKVEVIEDEEDIKERGVFKTRIEGVGITSRAMARRVGQHKIFASIDENQTVAFTAGLESLLCQPGDLVTIEDELKTNKANFGKILAVDIANETIRISNSLDADTMNTGTLTVYNPTGRDTIDGIGEFAAIDRTRYESFDVTGFSTPSWVRYTGSYGFSGYTSGYNVSITGSDPRHQEYGLYTGVSGTFLYFETGVTGWTFASGTGAGNAGAFDLASGDFIAETTGAQSIPDFNSGQISVWSATPADHRGAAEPFSGLDIESLVGPYRGVLNSEIAETSPNQMAVLSITGVNVSNPTDLEYSGFNPYGTVVSGFDKPQLLPFVKLGSPTKFEITDASPFIYKVISMKEDAPNEYLVTATKYDTGKFNLIEKDISIENKANTYSYQVAQTINDIQYSTLPCPLLDNVTTGEPDAVSQTFSITGMWAEVSNRTGYNVRLTQPNGSVISESVTTTGHEITGLGQVGVFNFCVNALGNKGGEAEVNAYYDSPYDCSGIFVVYDELQIFNRSFLERITIL
jgi:hypothetical protein